MFQIKVADQHNPIKGLCQAPASKSVLQRFLALTLVTRQELVLNHVSWCNDSLALRNILSDLGFSIHEEAQQLHISPPKKLNDKSAFSVGESGLALRMMIPILALFKDNFILKAEGSLRHRDLSDLEDNLKALGIKAHFNSKNYAWKIEGALNRDTYLIDASKSSQLLSGLLIALSASESASTIEVKDLVSRSYIDLSIVVLQQIGVEISHDDYKKFRINPPNTFRKLNMDIEGDWSAAAFFMVLAAVGGDLKIKGLSFESKQADKAIIEVLKKVGSHIQVEKEFIRVKKASLNAFTFDASHCPDLFPPLSVLACFCDGESQIIGTKRLINKESNRAQAIYEQLTSMGVDIREEKGSFFIKGGAAFKSANLKSYQDHRMLMSAVCMALLSGKDIGIDSLQAVSKSYPLFISDLQKIADFKIEEN